MSWLSAPPGPRSCAASCLCPPPAWEKARGHQTRGRRWHVGVAGAAEELQIQAWFPADATHKGVANGRRN